jgi:membrane-associated protease RseP (regulator of RpoE activity)
MAINESAINESKRVYRLADALVLLLLSMVPVMALLAAAEGRAVAPTMLFWLVLLLPMVLVAWLLTWRDPEESTNGHRVAAIRVPHVEGLAAEFEQLVTPFVRPSRSYVEAGVPVVEGTPLVPADGLFSQLERRLAARRIIPFIEEIEEGRVRVVGLPGEVDARLRTRSSPAVHLLLFIATVITAVYAGARQQGVNLLEEPSLFPIGLPYALSLLTILGVHELGHYAMARRHGVEVTLPFFIPFPMGLGTLGAFIQMKSLIKTRRAIFDIGIAGPLAGLVVALPLLYFGVGTESAPSSDGNRFAVDAGSSMFLTLLQHLAYGSDINTATVNLSPVAFAAWIGVFITALNLLPVGQLDGGHIAYALFGRRHARAVSIATVSLMVGLGLLVWPGLLTWALIVTLIAGFSHMPALDDVTRPDAKRFALGVLTLAVPILIVIPVPKAFAAPTLDSPYQGRLLVNEGAR